ncbi:MAG TPA: bacteriohemerythrin [Azospirillum sp.]
MTMELVAWDDKMSVGVGVLDEDHRLLLDMFNSLLQAGVSRRNKEALSALLTRLGEYTDVHFSREEAYMERCAYPDLEAHKAAHRYFVDEVDKLRHDFDGGNETMLRIDLILLLKDWLIEHIQSTDKQYTPYVTG